MTLRQLRTRIKFCGFQAPADVEEAIALGVDAIGLIFAPSPRRIDLESAVNIAASVPPGVTLVGVWVNPDEAEFQTVSARLPQLIAQFSGDESFERCERLAAGKPYLRVQHMPSRTAAPADLPAAEAVSDIPPGHGVALFDTQSAGRRGGTGETFDWAAFPRPVFRFGIAGGLNPGNVADAVRILRPYLVDVRSGIEDGGRKDRARMAAFVAAVRAADEEIAHATR